MVSLGRSSRPQSASEPQLRSVGVRKLAEPHESAAKCDACSAEGVPRVVLINKRPAACVCWVSAGGRASQPTSDKTGAAPVARAFA